MLWEAVYTAYRNTNPPHMKLFQLEKYTHDNTYLLGYFWLAGGICLCICKCSGLDAKKPLYSYSVYNEVCIFEPRL